MSEQTIEQKLSAEIVTLKSRILDTQDQAARLMEESKILQGTLAEIARAVGITGDTIKVEEIVEAVKNLTAESTDEAKDKE
ncbi:tail fiber chaperone [Enterobacteria phage RB68]|uniref:Chaperone for tail fiber formation n=3 Tax=Tequatrovirus TaxID=10663 RepID=A0A6B9WIM1_9CAUD|nr:tail fiber chaperone [Enterobacteria phage RB51]YP_009167515.1 tail fiber chaperone [Enterobacteria phage RB68]YP_010074348.1 tail fiber chaperone [Escherichia phage teqhad]UJJ74529.1 chaperone for tail fiber formation [Enterobacteria phage Ac3]URY15790.1 tail fiber assembly protein [Shigella phage ESH35]ACP31064.1 gp57A chaperone long and short tail fiber assembly [Enterobacteria phage RB51]AIT75606.1 chaperone for tail fiber formation [Enterobacteria phage RB68]QHR63498.1 chaperone for 